MTGMPFHKIVLGSGLAGLVSLPGTPYYDTIMLLATAVGDGVGVASRRPNPAVQYYYIYTNRINMRQVPAGNRKVEKSGLVVQKKGNKDVEEPFTPKECVSARSLNLKGILTRSGCLLSLAKLLNRVHIVKSRNCLVS